MLTYSTEPICLNIDKHSSEAPPCYDPQREAIPAEIVAKGFARDDPAILPAVVEGPYSQSACKINIFSVSSTKI